MFGSQKQKKQKETDIKQGVRKELVTCSKLVQNTVDKSTVSP